MVSVPTLFYVLVVSVSVHGSAIPSISRYRLFREERIVGGSRIKISDAPHQVSLLRYKAHMCGGSMISPYHVLTAAHCCRATIELNSLLIGSGSEYLPSLEVRAAVRTVFHPKYNRAKLDYDAGVIKVETPFVESAVRKPIALVAAGEEVANGEQVTVTGWGYTRDDANDQNLLRSVQVNIVNHGLCEKVYADKISVTARMICAGIPAGGKGPCQGDSGGALVVKSTGKQVGIVSWGYGCAHEEYPGVYANVADSEVHDFIDSELKQLVILDSSNQTKV